MPRHQTSKVATILFQRRTGVVCTINNISPAGALLLVGDAHDFPDGFDLQVDSYRRRCVAKWRRLDRIGVRFRSFAGAH